jgi:CRP/FNR family transcriptional regulator, cyclic AMP receptor protein
MTPHELFRRHPVLSALTEGEVHELLKHAHQKRVPAGQVVYYKDDPGDGMYGVLSGRAVATVESIGGKELILNTFGPGELFGEIALLDGKGRTATIVAREPSELLFLGRSVFLPFLRDRHEAAVRIISFLCERLRRTTTLVEDSTFLSVPTRLAKQLAILVDNYGLHDQSSSGVTIRISQGELAQMLGVSREIVSRQLAIWRAAGMIKLGRGNLTICDSRALDRIGGGN